MKNLKPYLLFFLATIVIVISFLFLLISTAKFTELFYQTFSFYSHKAIFPLYIRFLITVALIVIIYLMYKKLKISNEEIDERRRIEKELLKESRKLELSLAFRSATLEATADGILVVSKNRKIVVYNKKFVKMWNIPSELLRPGNNKKVEKFLLKQVKYPDKFMKNFERFYTAYPHIESRDYIEFKDGRVFERHAIPQMWGDNVIGRVFSFRDVTANKEQEEQLIHQATHDALTSLPNRVLLQDRIQQALLSYERTHQMATVLFLDLDGFKLVNDNLGHDYGDILLQSIARRLESCVRKQDTVARWGGDEFVIVLTGLSKEEDIVRIVRKCLNAVEKPITLDNHKVKVTLSVGISILPKDGETPAKLLKNSDISMQRSKKEGPNNYAFYSDVKAGLLKDNP